MRTQGELHLTFGRSTSGNYDHAVRMARKLPGYSTTGEGRSLRHEVKTCEFMRDPSVWKTFHELLMAVRSWKSTTLDINGVSAGSRWQLEVELYRVRECFQRRPEGAAGDDYCLGKEAPTREPSFFGCRWEVGVSLSSASSNGYFREKAGRWYEFGNLSSDETVFQVDKSRLQAALEAANRTSICSVCPAFSVERMQRTVDSLPTEISLLEASRFEVVRSRHDGTRGIGIRPKESRHGALSVRIGLGDIEEQTAESGPRKRNVPTVRYADIGGQEAAVAAIRSALELPLKYPDHFAELGVEPRGGVLLYGPPGTGKTLLAKAVATEADAHLEVISGPEVKSRWVGQSEANLRAVFERSTALQPSIILIDELDAIAPDRDAMDHQHDISLIAQLLVLLDGLEDRGRVAVVATTNRLEAIDPAVRRPGRFDHTIEVPLPDATGRRMILDVLTRRMKIQAAIDLDSWAERTAGMSGADLAGLCREAATVAVARAAELGLPPTELSITAVDLERGFRSLSKKRPEAGLA